MALSFANTTTNFSNTDATSYSTASVTPSSNKLQLLAVTSRHASATPNTPTASGNGLTWVQIDTIQYDTSGSQRKLTLFRAMGASPSTGAITIDFAGQTQTGCIWSLIEVTGMDTTGTDGSGAIVQYKNNSNTTGSVNTLTVTLDSTPASDSAVFATFAIGDGSQTMSPGTGFTELTEQANTGEANLALCTIYDISSADTTADVTATGNSEIGGIAVEVKIAAVAAVVKLLGLTGVGG